MQVAVIGGTRGLGNWIANFLKNKGCQVTITGRNTLLGEAIATKMGVYYTSSNTQAASSAQVVIVAVPIEFTPQTIKEVAPYLQEGALLVDVTSVKELPAQIMQETVPAGVEVLPTHYVWPPDKVTGGTGHSPHPSKQGELVSSSGGIFKIRTSTYPGNHP